MERGSDARQTQLPWTGERFIPGEGGDIIALEHFHRYRLAKAYSAGQTVLDLGCGAGYGSTMLKDGGASMVIGVDISFEAASFVKRQDGDLLLAVSSGTALPLRDAAVDVVVCFEVIEHIDDPEGLVSEARRVLRPGGAFIVSTPNKSVYNEFMSEPNPFHPSEMELAEFRHLLSRHFDNVAFSAQKVVLASVIWQLNEADPRPIISQNSEPPEAPYIIAVCSDHSVRPMETSAFSSWRVIEGIAEQSRYLADSAARELAAREHIAAIETALGQLSRALQDSDEREQSARAQMTRDAVEIDRLQGMLDRANNGR